MPTNFELVCEEENVRLDVFLAEKLALTRTKVKDMIEHGHVLVNGREVKPSLMIKRTMRVTGVIPEEEPLSLVAQDIPLEILYEDEYFLAINKQADMVVHPSAGHASGTLVNAVLAYLEKGKRLKVQGERFKNLEPLTLNLEPDYPYTRPPTPDTGRAPLTFNLEPSAWNLESAAPNSALRPGIVHRLDKGTTGVILIAKDAKTQ
ncbi:MAG TPA: S4 domain-containing protein, partial [Syntrophorhabdaceae bacterium]|nr:S4 domain-containing protein [Syntrophorhabdaceae bacterium]